MLLRTARLAVSWPVTYAHKHVMVLLRHCYEGEPELPALLAVWHPVKLLTGSFEPACSRPLNPRPAIPAPLSAA